MPREARKPRADPWDSKGEAMTNSEFPPTPWLSTEERAEYIASVAYMSLDTWLILHGPRQPERKGCGFWGSMHDGADI